MRERLQGSTPVEDPSRWRVPVRSELTAERLIGERLASSGIRRAAVLVPLVARPDGPALLLTQRAPHLKDHAGQISFPGGRIDPQDAGPAAAALRETQEEVAIAPAQVEILGFLDTYLTGTGFAVTPVVGAVAPDAVARANPAEVAEVFEVPLGYLVDPRNHGATSRVVGERSLEFFEIVWRRHRIWGATAGIIVGFSKLFNCVSGSCSDFPELD